MINILCETVWRLFIYDTTRHKRISDASSYNKNLDFQLTTKYQKKPLKTFGHDHLSASEHAAPTAIRRQSGLSDFREIFPVRKPETTRDFIRQVV